MFSCKLPGHLVTHRAWPSCPPATYSRPKRTPAATSLCRPPGMAHGPIARTTMDSKMPLPVCQRCPPKESILSIYIYISTSLKSRSRQSNFTKQECICQFLLAARLSSSEVRTQKGNKTVSNSAASLSHSTYVICACREHGKKASWNSMK